MIEKITKQIEKTEDISNLVEKLPEKLMSDIDNAINCVKDNPYKATTLAAVTLVALKNKTLRGLVGSAAVAFVSSRISSSSKHTLH